MDAVTNTTAIADQPAAQPTAAPAWEWAVVEIFGHRRHAGRCIEVEKFGAKLLRVDVPSFPPTPPQLDAVADGNPPELAPAIVWTTHFYGGSAIFSYTLTDEDSVMRANRPWAPPSPKRLPAPEPVDGGGEDYDDRSFDEGDERADA